MEIQVATSEKVLSHHNITKANDITTAQYSLPFCLATAAYRNPNEPKSFLDNPHEDAKIVALAQKMSISLNEDSLKPGLAWATDMTVVLNNGKKVHGMRKDFRGAPSDPMSAQEFDTKFLTLTSDVTPNAEAILQKLRRLEELEDISGLFQF